jgi:hypothetical protein
MNTQDEKISLLREEIEKALGKTLKTPKDFDFLSECVFEKLHENISPTTLKRLWGYLHDAGSTPRQSTLDLLSRFIGYSDFNAFSVADEDPVADKPNVSPVQTPIQPAAKKPFFTLHSLLFIVLGLLLLISLPFAIRGLRTPKPNILYRGTHFASYEEYFKLFGLEPDPHLPYYTQHPEYPCIYFWAPEYEHHVWHNEGNPDSLMPSITTYYYPDDLPNDSASLAQVAIFNKRRYVNAISECPVLLTFMKNLFDSTYIFLGVYRLSAESDTTRQVWKRVQNDVDIDHLKVLERYHY